MSAVRARLREVKDHYAHGHDRPLGAYLALDGAYAALVAALGAEVARRGGPPERIGAGDLALLSLATHKLSRLLAKGTVTSPVRAPFTRYQGTSGPSELEEEVRGDGLRHALGELVSCPFCLAQWIATGFVFGLALSPRATRMAASVLAVTAGSDALQLLYGKLEQNA